MRIISAQPRGWQELLPLPVMGVIVGRDLLLLGGAFYIRGKALPGQPFTLSSFFKLKGGDEPDRSQSRRTGKLAPLAEL